MRDFEKKLTARLMPFLPTHGAHFAADEGERSCVICGDYSAGNNSLPVTDRRSLPWSGPAGRAICTEPPVAN